MSLTEVLIAMALIALCIGGIVSLLVQGIRMGKGVDYMYVATNLAKNRIERIREVRKDLGYAAMTDSAETDVLIGRNGASDPNGNFKRTTIIDSSDPSGLTRVTVRVSYKIKDVFTGQPAEIVTLLSSYNP